jgi:two-component system LytT family response regulator
MTIRYLIVDDEAPGRVNLRLAMNEHPDWQLVAECESAAAARAVLAGRNADVDLVFLDVQMPGESGLVLARELSRLREPLSDARLARAVERSADMLRQRQREAYGAALRSYVDADAGARPFADHLNVRSVGRIEQVRVAEILWLAAAGNYVELHLLGRTVLHRITLNRLEALLDPAVFLRVHRGAIVRRDQLARLATTGDGTYRLGLRCAAEVAVSERYLAALKAAM